MNERSVKFYRLFVKCHVTRYSLYEFLSPMTQNYTHDNIFFSSHFQFLKNITISSGKYCFGFCKKNTKTKIAQWNTEKDEISEASTEISSWSFASFYCVHFQIAASKFSAVYFLFWLMSPSLSLNAREVEKVQSWLWRQKRRQVVVINWIVQKISGA